MDFVRTIDPRRAMAREESACSTSARVVLAAMIGALTLATNPTNALAEEEPARNATTVVGYWKG